MKQYITILLQKKGAHGDQYFRDSLHLVEAGNRKFSASVASLVGAIKRKCNNYHNAGSDASSHIKSHRGGT